MAVKGCSFRVCSLLLYAVASYEKLWRISSASYKAGRLVGKTARSVWTNRTWIECKWMYQPFEMNMERVLTCETGSDTQLAWV